MISADDSNLDFLRAVVVVVGMGLPILFYHAVEEPMVRVGKRVADRIPVRRIARLASVAS